MRDLYNNAKFIIGFLVIVLVIQTVFGDKVAEKMTLFTLFSMLILNADNFADYLKNFSKTSTSDSGKSTVHKGTGGRTFGGGGRKL